MNEQDYLLMCLIEECSEVIKEVTKSLRFGLDNYNPKDPSKSLNIDKLADELNDIIAVVYMLQDLGTLPEDLLNMKKLTAKREKVKKYMEMYKK